MGLLPTEKTQKKTSFFTQNTLIYGLPKSGKSSFAAQIPNALFFTTEEGYNHLEIYNIKITKWEDVYTAMRELATTKHKFQTIVIDIADYFFKHCETYILNKFGKEHASDMGFGKGYTLIRDEFTKVVNAINQSGFGLVFISHAKERELTKTTSKFTYMDTTLPKAPSEVICGLVDYILYFYIDNDGKRLIRTKPSKYINAGDRSGMLPEIMPLDYGSFIEAFQPAPGSLPAKQKEKS
jgi:hypothetical protein